MLVQDHRVCSACKKRWFCLQDYLRSFSSGFMVELWKRCSGLQNIDVWFGICADGAVRMVPSLNSTPMCWCTSRGGDVDGRGFELGLTRWDKTCIPDLSGKVAVVTGANSGLGYEVTKGLAAKGSHVVMGCRSLEKGGSAAQQIRKEVPDASLTVMKLDLADLSTVRDFSSRFKKEYHSLDILCNNAGIMQAPRGQTADGFETHLGINHFGHFALTGLLMDPLLNTKGSRVVTVSSTAHKLGSVDFDNLGLSGRYSRTGAYARSKLANLLFTYELQRRLDDSGLSTISVAAHPGLSATNLQITGPRMGNGHFFAWMYKVVNGVLAQSAQMGALPLLYAATAEDVSGGDYIGPGGLGEWRGYPKKTKSSKKSHDEESAKQLWDISTELTKVQYPDLK